jgi:hypothetical protein
MLLCFLTAPLAAQTPPTPPTTSTRTDPRYVRELLPDLGQIGAEVGLNAAFCRHPYETGTGGGASGFILLPVARALGGRISYEIDVRYGMAEGDPFTITNPLAYVANLAAGASPAAAAAGPPAAPFPVRRDVRTKLRLLQVSPFGLRYALGGATVPRLRPYVSAGVDVVVVLTQQEPVRRDITDPLGAAAFDVPLVAGIVGQAPELEALGLPSGQGNLRLGGYGAVGVEWRATGRVSLNAEYRLAGIEGAGTPQQAWQAGVGLHW